MSISTETSKVGVATIDVSVSGGEVKSFPSGITAKEVLQHCGVDQPDVFAVSVDRVPMDLSTPLTQNGSLEPISFSSPDGKDIYRHSSTHIMAQAVKDVFPTANVTIGPAIEEGFFYDFAFERPFTPEDLEKIEARAHEIMKADLPITRLEMSKDEAVQFFENKKEAFKVEIIKQIEDDRVSLYQQGDFVDLCRGPHVGSTGQVKALKLLSSAGAYWRGDERNPMLQRIYGTSFPTQSELDDHLANLEEIKRRDHRKLGKELDLFSVQDEIGPGLILWHPKEP